jgi:hypothetical protein
MASSKECQCDIIGTTHLHTKVNIFRAKTVVPYLTLVVNVL